ncbi:acetyltransferase [Diplodia corticola]|uniref:Acetyltransferase n=1 Tax=Diplodia corticola TaxID=236234 RepID=A0A1J9S926_9PEZI|nr:acetyltransferase [Diplodia corticola]OJD36085.1 acetyltransferase [Diplodia corticola]
MFVEVDEAENRQKMNRGELYYAFSPDLIAARDRCRHACKRYATIGDVPRRRLVELWREISNDTRPLPPPAATREEDDALFEDEPWIEGPMHIDYGYNVKLGPNVYVNANCTIIDTLTVSIGARTLLGPNCALYSGTHPLDPLLRNGTRGPESGGAIHIGEDCWLGGNVVVLPGVTVGRGSTVGAGSVVTKDVPPFHVVAGNPARVLRKIDTMMDPEYAARKQQQAAAAANTGPGGMMTAEDVLHGMQAHGAEVEMREQAERAERAEQAEQEEASQPLDEERLWRAFAASEKGAAEAGAYKT